MYAWDNEWVYIYSKAFKLILSAFPKQSDWREFKNSLIWRYM